MRCYLIVAKHNLSLISKSLRWFLIMKLKQFQRVVDILRRAKIINSPTKSHVRCTVLSPSHLQNSPAFSLWLAQQIGTRQPLILCKVKNASKTFHISVTNKAVTVRLKATIEQTLRLNRRRIFLLEYEWIPQLFTLLQRFPAWIISLRWKLYLQVKIWHHSNAVPTNTSFKLYMHTKTSVVFAEPCRECQSKIRYFLFLSSGMVQLTTRQCSL